MTAPTPAEQASAVNSVGKALNEIYRNFGTTRYCFCFLRISLPPWGKKKAFFFLLASADIGLIHADTFGIIIL